MSESKIQQNICTYLSMIAHQTGIVYFSVPNELYGAGKSKKKLTGPEYGMINKYKSMGLLPGVSDLIIIWQGKAFCMEVKTATGKQSSDQILFESNIVKAGGKYEVVRGIDDTQRVLKLWGIM